jgi:hypothetical protein
VDEFFDGYGIDLSALPVSSALLFPLTIKALAERLPGTADATNIQSRTFRPSFPVLHLAIALEVLAELAKLRRRYSSTQFYEYSLHPHFVRIALFLGRGAASLIAETPKLRRAAAQLIDFRLA